MFLLSRGRVTDNPTTEKAKLQTSGAADANLNTIAFSHEAMKNPLQHFKVVNPCQTFESPASRAESAQTLHREQLGTGTSK